MIQKLEETQRELKVAICIKRPRNIIFPDPFLHGDVGRKGIIFPSEDFANNSYIWKTLYQLQWENDLLKEENDTLIKVLAKIKK